MSENTPLIFTNNISNNLQDDCACPDISFESKLPTNIPNVIHQTLKPVQCTQLPKNFHLLFNPLAPSNPNILNQPAWQRYQTFTQQPQLLSQPIDYQLARQRLITPANQKVTITQPVSDSLTVWLNMTNACNLECTYCYVHKTAEQMTEKTGKLAIDNVISYALKKQFKQLKLKFAGGEPLLNFKQIQTLYHYAQQLTQQHNISLQAVILSNGTLLTETVANWIKNNHVDLMISVDGLGKIHDKQRPAKNGQSSFSLIEHNLTHYLLPLDIKPTISVTLTQQNAETLAETVEWIVTQDLPLSLNFYRQNAQACDETLKLEETQIIENIRAAYEVIEHHLPYYSHSLANNLLDRVYAHAHTHTCGVNQNYLVVTHTGEFRQCHMQLNQQTPVQLIQNLSVNEKTDCRGCAFRYYCTGGCPLETFHHTGHWDVKSPHCTIYKTLYPALLRLEGLRLLKSKNVLF